MCKRGGTAKRFRLRSFLIVCGLRPSNAAKSARSKIAFSISTPKKASRSMRGAERRNKAPTRAGLRHRVTLLYSRWIYMRRFRLCGVSISAGISICGKRRRPQKAFCRDAAYLALLTACRSCRRVLVRIPRKLRTRSSSNWIPVPEKTEHRGRDNAALRFCLIPGRANLSNQPVYFAANLLSIELVGILDQTVWDCLGQRGVADGCEPMFNWKLAGRRK
jgi:hypothetical protein